MVASNAASRFLTKISIFSLNVGSGMLRLSSCLLRLNLASSGKLGEGLTGCWGASLDFQVRLRLSMNELGMSMLEPMLSLSMPL